MSKYINLILVTVLVLCTNQAFAQKESINTVLYKTFSKKGIDSAVKKYQKLKKEDDDKYEFAEAELNILGYRLIAEGKNKAAIIIFELNTKMYPESPNAFDSLGEAYLRAGDSEKAAQQYERVLEMTPKSQLDDKTKSFIEKNAASKLAYINSSESERESTVLEDFLSNSENPYGRLHPDAPPETELWGQLAGEWQCTAQILQPNGQWGPGGKAKWVWKYTLDGFAVQDVWFVEWLDLPPGMAQINRPFVGTNFRIFDPEKGKWEAIWFANNKNRMSTFVAINDGDKVIMEGKNRGRHSRITFYNMSENSFDWKSETSKDDGKTWQETTQIHGTKIKRGNRKS